MGITPIQSRLVNFRDALSQNSFDAFFIADTSNVTYLSGYTNHESFLFITGNANGSANVFITDFRYAEQARAECPDYEIILHRNGKPSLEDNLARLCEQYGVRRMAFESLHTSYSRYQSMTSILKNEIELVPAEKIAETLRSVKDETEQACLRMACAATDKVFAEVCRFIRPGVTEKDVEWKLLRGIRDQGCEPGAPCIVVSGERGSLPHGVPSDKRLRSGEFVTMDFGCMYRGYRADMTRTVFIGRPDMKQKAVYDIVLQANLLAESIIKNGAGAKAVDSAARDYIAEMGYGEYFGHGLGHGVGLDIHEHPFMNPMSDETLRTGCFITVEPGIYLPNWGGVRIEDTVMVTEQGCEVLFQSPKEQILL